MIATDIVAVAAVAGAVLVAGLAMRPRTSRPAAPAAPWAWQVRRWSGLRTALTRRHSRRSPSPRSVAEWCDELARRARSGATLRDALTNTLPADEATRACTDELRLALQRGRTTAEATAERSPHDGPHLALARRVIETTARLGGPCAASIDRTAALLRQRAADGEERSAQAAQARLSAHVLTAVPLVMLGLLMATDGDTRDVITSALGVACVTIGLSLNAVGWLWMRRLVGVRR